MLERFKVPKKDEVRVPIESLQEVIQAIFEKMGNSESDAIEAAEVLSMTDLRGVETHGVSNMLRAYVTQYTSGQVNPRPNWRIERQTRGTAVINADKGLGVVLGRRAMDIAIEKARDVGFGVVTMNNGAHLGAVGHFSMYAAEHDMVGMCATSAGRGVLPTFGAEGRFGTNPISIAAPANKEAPCCSTLPHRRLPATSSPSPAGSAQTCFPAGSPTKKATPSWSRRPSPAEKASTTAASSPWAARARTARTRATASS